MSNAPQHQTDFTDELSLWQMDLMTMTAKLLMPHGIWHGNHSPDAHRRRAAREQAQVAGSATELEVPPSIYLTFDDGPHPDTTPYLLELLEESGAKATFFLMGSQVKKHPRLVEEIVRAGHAIGNHTYHHHFMPLLSVHRMEREIEMTNDGIDYAAGSKPILFRPPYGIVDSRTVDLLHERSMTTVFWSMVPFDWNPIGARRVVARVRKRINDGALVVLHEGKGIADQSIEATGDLIRLGTHAGYKFKALA